MFVCVHVYVYVYVYVFMYTVEFKLLTICRFLVHSLKYYTTNCFGWCLFSSTYQYQTISWAIISQARQLGVTAAQMTHDWLDVCALTDTALVIHCFLNPTAPECLCC